MRRISGLAAAVLLFAAALPPGRPAAAVDPAAGVPPALVRGVREAAALRAALASVDVPAGDPARLPILRLFASGAWPLRSDRVHLASDPVDRADAVAALQRLLGRPLADVAAPTPAGRPAGGNQTAPRAPGAGSGTRSPAPTAPVATREDVAVWAAIAAGLPPAAPGPGGAAALPDADEVADGRLPYVEAAYRAGLLDGLLVGGEALRLRPADAVTLGQFAGVVDRLRERGAFPDWGPLISARVATATDEWRAGPSGPARVRAWTLAVGDGEVHRLEVQRGADGGILREAVRLRGDALTFTDELRPGDRVQYVVRGGEVALLEHAGDAVGRPAVIRRVGRQPATLTVEFDGVARTYDVAPGVAVTYGGYPAGWPDVRPGLSAWVEVAGDRVTRVDVAWSGAALSRPERPVTGVVLWLEDGVLTIRGPGGRLYSLAIDSDTRVVMDGRLVGRAALQTGDVVTVVPKGAGYYRAARIEVSPLAGSPVEVYRAQFDDFLADRGLLQFTGLARWDWGAWSPVAPLSRFELAEEAVLYVDDEVVTPLEFAEAARGEIVYFAAQRRAGRQVALKLAAGPAETSSLNGEGEEFDGGGVGLYVGCCTVADESRVRLSVDAATIAVRDGRLVEPALPDVGVHYFAAVQEGPDGFGEETASRAVVLTRESPLPPGTALAWGLAETSRGETLALSPYRTFDEYAWSDASDSDDDDPLDLRFAPQASVRDLLPAAPQYITPEALRLGTLSGSATYLGSMVYAWQRDGGIAAADVLAYDVTLEPDEDQTVALAVVDAVYGNGDTLLLRNLRTWEDGPDRWWPDASGTVTLGTTRALLVDGEGRIDPASFRAGDRVVAFYRGGEAAVVIRRSAILPGPEWP